MLDIGLPYTEAIPVGEDNEAVRIIGYSGRLTRNVRHIATQKANLQSLIRDEVMAMFRVGTQDNASDHFTKMLPGLTFTRHTDHMMGTRFITPAHARALQVRNNSSTKK